VVSERTFLAWALDAPTNYTLGTVFVRRRNNAVTVSFPALETATEYNPPPVSKGVAL
jgi:hypothetical protein